MPSAGAAAIIADLDRLAAELVAELAGLATEQEIRAAQARYLGKKGRLAEPMKALGPLPAEDRPALGEAANRAKGTIDAAGGPRLRAPPEAPLGPDPSPGPNLPPPARAPR